MANIPVTIEFSAVGVEKVDSAFKRLETGTQRTERASRSAGKEMGGFRGKLDELAKSVRLIEGPLGGTAARLQTLVGVVTRLNPIIAGIVVGIAALGGVFAVIFPKLLAVRKEFDTIFNTLRAGFGGTVQAQNEFNYLTEISRRLGLEFGSAAEQYSKLAAAARTSSLDQATVRSIFESIAQASTALGLSADQTAGALNAVQQMISKGNVQAEELRGQLGERLPGAFNLAAEAMGVTTQQLNKMLDTGQVLADELLPRLAARLSELYSKDALTGAENLTGQLNKLNTEWKGILDKYDKILGISGFYKDTLGALTNFLKGRNNAMQQALEETGKIVSTHDYLMLQAASRWNMYKGGGLPPIQDVRSVGPVPAPFSPDEKVIPKLKDTGIGGEASDYWNKQNNLNILYEKRDEILKRLTVDYSSLILTEQDLLTPQELYNKQMETLAGIYGPGGISENQELYRRGVVKLQEELAATDPILKRLSSGFDGLASSIVNSMTTASSAMESFRSIAMSVLKSVLEGILQLTVFDPLKKAFLGFAGSALGLTTGGGGTMSWHDQLLNAGSHQYGGAFDVPGVGGVDNKYVGMMMSPGEKVKVTPRNQKDEGGQNFYVDMRGADTQAVARLEQFVKSINASIEPRSVAAVFSASRSQPNLLSRRR